MKALILKNYSTTQSWGQLTIDSIRGHIARHDAEVQIDVCSVCDGETPPTARDYDLIILTGGTFNLIADPPLPWITKVIGLIRDVSGQQGGHTKLLGFCWGHQVIQHALGGSLDVLEGSNIGVEKVQLTPAGQNWFQRDDLTLHKYHKRCVKTPAAKFAALAARSEIFLSGDERVLTFQAHPELTEEISRSLMEGDDGSYTAGIETPSNVKLLGIDSVHDGVIVWDRIMQWVRSK